MIIDRPQVNENDYQNHFWVKNLLNFTGSRKLPLMPEHRIFCPENGKTIESDTGGTESVKTWGELCRLLELEPENTPLESPVHYVTQGSATSNTDIPATKDTGPAMTPIGHPWGCVCCTPELSPGMMAFQEKLRKSLFEKGKQ